VRDVLFDADAFLCIRKLSLLHTLAGASGLWLMTEYIANHELGMLASEIQALCQSQRLHIRRLPGRDPHFRELKQKGHDKGEAEAIAWAMQLPRRERPLFISLDKGARDGARENGVPTGDIMDLMVEAVASGEISFEDAREKASIWDDKKQVLGRPSDYATFEETFTRRRLARQQSCDS
jgi:predicted nucleic acid-binding protein